jgi:transcriptional regulator with XRE-family HTH domain
MRLAKMLRLYLAAEELEQRTVAGECGVSETTLSRFLAGDRLPDAAGFARIQAWCAGVVFAPTKRAFNPDAKIGGPDAPYRTEKP